ncbi:YbfB/YjiJ family MFS transporter [Streptomyces sp. NPDC002888]|uniref:YbfB/YjiJ family MFS transporter n=1 Tax=Streptomyces sp. NPDC002888 TaxID=3364668 RepID=UPI0036891F9F
MDVELRHLRAFTAVARHRSFSRAAEELLITQPALSRTIAQLEGNLSIRLLDRSSRHVELTDIGAEFLVHAERVLATLDQALAAVSHRVTLRLGFSWLLPDPWAQQTVSRFEESTGASVALTRTDDPLQALRRRTLDIVLVRGDVDATRGARTMHLYDEPRIAVCFLALLASYTFEGIGYIIAGTFLVAAIQQGVKGWLGSAAWIVVGLAALPSCALWTRLARRWSRPVLLLASLTIQAIGIALSALLGGATPALVSAVLFGATFMGVSTIALSIGSHLQVPRAVALLTAGYSAGQILGPLLAAPLLSHGYHQALLLGSAMVVVAAVSAAAVCVRFPHHLGPVTSAA